MTEEPIAIGKVETLAINGKQMRDIWFEIKGPRGDKHSGFTRRLSGHDGGYIQTSELRVLSKVFNWRSWTAISTEEIRSVEESLGYNIPVGCLLENIRISGIPGFSQLEPGTRLVFPPYYDGLDVRQAILAVWEENGPCATVGRRLEDRHGVEGLKTDFIREAQNRRGVMGFVLSYGLVSEEDRVLVYPPVR